MAPHTARKFALLDETNRICRQITWIMWATLVAAAGLVANVWLHGPWQLTVLGNVLLLASAWGVGYYRRWLGEVRRSMAELGIPIVTRPPQ